MTISNSPQTVKNTAYGNRVADLAADQSNGPLIGWTYHNGPNQQWNFEPQHGKEFKISTMASGGNPVYVSSPDPQPGDHVDAGAESSLYTVQEHNGYYQISIHTEEGTTLYWTLSTAARGKKITLETANNSVNQLWALSPAPDA